MDILMRPIVTERSMRDAATGRFTFAVARAANKAQIADAVKRTFKVNALSVRTVTISRKARRAGKARKVIFSEPWKKAIVELAPGEKIDIFDVTEEHKHA